MAEIEFEQGALSDVPNPYDKVNEVYQKLAGHLTDGGEAKLAPIQLAHYPVRDTELAACLVTLGIPLRQPGPYTRTVDVDEKGNEAGQQMCWWVGEVSVGGGEEAHKTEEIMGAWQFPARFRAEHPMHPLNAMRDAIEARNYWLGVIFQRTTLPLSVARTDVYVTDSIHGASVLKACGFAPVAFSGRAFVLEGSKDGVRAEQVLVQAAKAVGRDETQWMARCLKNLGELLKYAKRSETIIRERTGENQVLLLSADCDRKVVDRFHALL